MVTVGGCGCQDSRAGIWLERVLVTVGGIRDYS